MGPHFGVFLFCPMAVADSVKDWYKNLNFAYPINDWQRGFVKRYIIVNMVFSVNDGEDIYLECIENNSENF